MKGNFKIIIARKDWSYNDNHEDVLGYFFGKNAKKEAIKVINDDIRETRQEHWRGYLVSAKKENSKFEYDDVWYDYYLDEEEVKNTNVIETKQIKKTVLFYQGEELELKTATA